MHGQHIPVRGAAAAAVGSIAVAPAAEAQAATEWALQRTSPSMSAGMAAPQSRQYPSVADLEVAGEELDSSALLKDIQSSHSVICTFR